MSEPGPLMAHLLVDSLRQQLATLTEALEKLATEMRQTWHFDARIGHIVSANKVHEWADRLITLASEPIVYVRCTCKHPGDTPACDVDHDQVQHERET